MLKLENKPLYFLGDFHGCWDNVWDIVLVKGIQDCNIICVGDVGFGFEHAFAQEATLNMYNENFRLRNINFYTIRGNHDDPSFFQGEKRVCLSNLKTIKDYTVATWQDKTFQFIGGAISIDRTGRVDGKSYWTKEVVDYKPEKLQKVDVLVTHTCPSWCFPQKFNEMVYGWAREDAYLIEDLSEERAVMDEIFKLCQPSFHFYGHFHSSCTETINGCMHKLLDIYEFWELR